MATLPTNIKPFSKLSPECTHPALQKTLEHVFEGVRKNLWLVGGTALSGFYSKHRVSDDLDLFSIDPHAFKAACLAATHIKDLGAKVENTLSTPNYHRDEIEFMNHHFTLDIVLDENLKSYGNAIPVDNGVWVADLKSLFTIKSSTLLSHSSEKDLYDLVWFFDTFKELTIHDILKEGIKVDLGFSIESLLTSLKGTYLRKTACDFLPPNSPLSKKDAFDKIMNLKEFLIQSLLEIEQKQPLSEQVKALKSSLKDQKKFKN